MTPGSLTRSTGQMCRWLQQPALQCGPALQRGTGGGREEPVGGRVGAGGGVMGRGGGAIGRGSEGGAHAGGSRGRGGPEGGSRGV